MTKWNLETVKEFVKINSKSILISNQYKNARTKLEFTCECGNEFKVSLDIFIRNNQRRCKVCSRKSANEKQSRSQEEFENVIKEKLGEDYKIIGKYKGNNKRIEILHLKCNKVWTTTCAGILHRNLKCGNCSPTRKTSHEEFLAKLKNIHGEEFQVLEDYMGTDTKIKFIHSKCNKEFYRTPYWILHNKSIWCPYCKESQGCKDIETWLENNNIKFVKEKRFSDCKSKRTLPFDFYLSEFKICIEFDGEHHIKDKKYFGKSNLNSVKNRDEIKTNYCSLNNIQLIRIPYKDKDNINEILNKFILKDNIVVIP
jgi:very-short-patch-repair endonuclease